MGKLKEILKIKEGEPDMEVDEIDEFLRREAKEAVMRAKLAKIKEYELESKLKMKELERKLKQLEEEEEETSRNRKEEPAITPGDIEVAKMLKDMPPEERREILSILAMLKASGRSEPAALMIPLIMAARASNPASSPAEIMRAVNEGLRTYKELIGGGRSETSVLKDVLEVVKSMTGGSLSEKLAEKYVDVLSKLATSRKGFWDEVMEDPKKVETLQKIFGGGQMDPRTMLELKRLEYDMQVKLKELDLKMEELRHKMAVERERMETIKRYGKSIAKAIIDGLMSEEGVEAPKPKKSKELLKGWAKAKCEVCGTEIAFNPKETKEIVCPKCGTKYRVEVK